MMKIRRTVLLLSALALAGAACDDEPAAPTGDAGDVTADADADTADAADVEGDGELPEPAFAPPSMGERGLFEVRSIIHLHSAFSHDGCDDEGLDADGNPNWPCVNRMKDALCRERIAVAFMTDHPAHMKEQPFDAVHYADEARGDVRLVDGDGHEWGVRYACPEGQGGPDGTVVQVAGFEGTHTMPVGLRRHLEDPSLYGVSFETETPTESLEAVTQAVRAAGGHVTIAHSEEPDLDWATIAAHDVSAMELYNFHANFNVILDSDLLEALAALDPFLAEGAGAPESDLVGLSMLGRYPEPALEKWRRVSVERTITAIAGSDVHENVVLPALCANPSICEGLAEDYPNISKQLEVEGPVMMPDGERIDAYGRIFRWVQNRFRIDPDADVLEATEAALEAGRNVVVFEMLGDAVGADLVANTGTEEAPEWREMGATVAAGTTLWARSPEAPVPGRNASWTDGSAGEMTATLWRSTADGSVAVDTWSEPGTWRSWTLDEPGAYHLEVTLVPRHLAGSLGSASELAEQSFRWVETNAIRVE